METIYEVVRVKQVVKEMNGVASIRSPRDLATLAFNLIGEEDREVFLVICLNTKNQAIAVHRVHVGTINASIIHPREVMKTAILNNAASIVVSHNHPSTNTTPSQEDLEVTERLKQAGEILGIELLDHIIVTPIEKNYISFREKGYM
ncbi:JAB domain-containing protein [Caryophanon latum]|uniref:DNA repair protein RadC n=1 Tax=Caryophanon latum TaxID=33977 RepID=A0A1C0Z1M8_9BACL|nr:DNA repair protein RadC [Caryophanon latum]OCS93357.1 DNA repair protein RadC [Caryophanon latum]